MTGKETTSSLNGIQSGEWEPHTHPGFSIVTRAKLADPGARGVLKGCESTGLGNLGRLWRSGV